MRGCDNTSDGGTQADNHDFSRSIIPTCDARIRLEKLEPRPRDAGAERGSGGRRTRGDRPRWHEVTKDGTPKKTCANARVAIEALGVRCRYDDFHDKMTIESSTMPLVTCASTETAAHLLRIQMDDSFTFDPRKDHTQDALAQLALTHRFDPMRDYFDGLQWDGQPRVEGWMTAYVGAQDTELNRWNGRLTLVAGVRRVRQPGCKFDQIPVWEGEEGTGKSSAIAVLAISPENFSDQTIIGAKDQQQQELLRGVFIYEISEPGGMQRAQVEAVKAFASRTHDRARPAYDRCRVDLPWRGIMIGTTNADAYLKSQTGNRRFWPVKTGAIDLTALRRDRDQLWAEAAAVEASGVSLVLPRELWASAREIQDARLEYDPWQDELEDLRGLAMVADGREQVSTLVLLRRLGRTEGKATTGGEMRLAPVMRRLGWTGPVRIRIDGRRCRGYFRAAE
jgi:predicted P-loop ATPase